VVEHCHSGIPILQTVIQRYTSTGWSTESARLRLRVCNSVSQQFSTCKAAMSNEH
jgi:hypothetical protein